jgi:hypothetical protein
MSRATFNPAQFNRFELLKLAMIDGFNQEMLRFVGRSKVK